MFLDQPPATRLRSGLVRSLPFRVAPWMFILGVAAGVLLAGDKLLIFKPFWTTEKANQEPVDENWRQLSTSPSRHVAQVLRTVDGDTFEARVRVWPNMEVMTRVRLRGIDAPERKASCAEEQRLAEAATVALAKLLRDGGVTIFNISPDKYAGRVVADVATHKTASVSSVLLELGMARPYEGGRRTGWCPAPR